MDRALLDLLACPTCGADLALDEREFREGLSARLRCTGCSRLYPVVGGVPRLNMHLEEHRLTNVARTFSYEWNAHDAGEFEDKTLFGRTREEDWTLIKEGMRISADDVKGTIVLDAGCGSGRFCQLFAEHGAATVVGVDMNAAVDAAARRCRAYDNIHLVQANIFALPFKRRAFDLVWCNGVIHHTSDAPGAHHSLAKHVRPGGILYVWVYAARFNPFRFAKSVLRIARIHRWPPRHIQLLSTAMAYISLGLLELYRVARRVPGLRPHSAWGRRTVRPRTVEELKLTWFDALSPEFDTRHSEAEVIDWFRREDFSDIEVLEEPKVGVRGVAPPKP